MNYLLFTLMILISLGMPIFVYTARNELSNAEKVGLLSFGLVMFLVDISRALQGLPNI